ncbi:MAG: hypothetical protein MZW92_76275 [Comamonadaceae bacterium]|nr:hypothetical protein [Comamonadaceae bacterium]
MNAKLLAHRRPVRRRRRRRLRALPAFHGSRRGFDSRRTRRAGPERTPHPLLVRPDGAASSASTSRASRPSWTWTWCPSTPTRTPARARPAVSIDPRMQQNLGVRLAEVEKTALEGGARRGRHGAGGRDPHPRRAVAGRRLRRAAAGACPATRP